MYYNPICKLGYENSLQCDSFQLGQAVKFFARKSIVPLLATFSPDASPPFSGSTSDLLDVMKEMPNYQIDANHRHCGVRGDLIPILALLRLVLQQGLGICSLCWRNNRAYHSWQTNPAGGTWRFGDYPSRVPNFTPARSIEDHSPGSHDCYRKLFTAQDWEWKGGANDG